MRDVNGQTGGPRLTVLRKLVFVGLAGVVTGGLSWNSGYAGQPNPGPSPSSRIGGTVNVLGVWGGDELQSFLAMVAPFEGRTGVKVEFEGTRDINAVLTTRVKGGNPPDVAALPGPGRISEYARSGTLVPLDSMVDRTALSQDYARSWLDLTTVKGRLYGVFIKVAVKGLIWYDPKVFRANRYGVPRTWDELLALTDHIARQNRTPWCIGLESGAASGWPASDWIEMIMLRTAGADRYTKWYRHEIAWTDPAVKKAWTLFGKIAANPRYVHGGIQGELATNFGESPFPLFTDPPGCYLHNQASFIQGFLAKQYPNLRPWEDVNFFSFPPIVRSVPQAVEVAGDLFGVFRDTPQARALIKYLVTPEAQAIWVKRGGALSPNRRVDPRVYPDPLSRRMAGILTAAKTVRFDASDIMPDEAGNAFLTGTLEYVQHPDRLDRILREINRIATAAAARP
ncbi:MAG TPA: ABC transporter substrate-binding protein [bacterium]|nr:ABC transporter substrate-binding protein [bacterium]